MKKAGYLLLLYTFVGIAYITLMALQPFTNSVVASVNSSINWTGFEETQAVIEGWPFWAYFVPASIGMAGTVMILRANFNE